MNETREKNENSSKYLKILGIGIGEKWKRRKKRDS